MYPQQQCVLAATDGSWRSGVVLDAAAAEASARAAPLTVVSVVREVVDPRYSLSALVQDEQRAAELTDWRLREALARVRARHPGLELSARRLTDRDLGWPGQDPAGLPDAQLLVLGARGAHAQPVFGLGTVSRHLLKVTACPVLVVPDGARTPPRRPAETVPPVVAGLGPDHAAEAVLLAAVQEAALRGTEVLAVGSDVTGRSARARLEALVERVGRDTPVEVPVTVRASSEPPAAALLSAARSASVLVLGTSGPAALAGLAQESVSRAVLDAAPCPVLLLVPRVARTAPPEPRRDQGPADPGTTALLTRPGQRRP